MLKIIFRYEFYHINLIIFDIIIFYNNFNRKVKKNRIERGGKEREGKTERERVKVQSTDTV